MIQAGMEVPESIRKFNILCNDGGTGAQLCLPSGEKRQNRGRRRVLRHPTANSSRISSTVTMA